MRRPQTAAGAPADLDLGVGALEIEDARIVWNDAATGSRWELTDFGLTAEGFGVGERFPLQMEFGLAGADVAVQVAADMQATLALADNEYRLDELDVTVDGSGAGWPGGPSQAALNFESLVANLADETLELTGLTLEFLGITMAGSLSGQRLMSNLALTGAVDIREFAPREVLERVRRRRANGRRRGARHARARRRICSTTRARWGCATCSSRSTTRR